MSLPTDLDNSALQPAIQASLWSRIEAFFFQPERPVGLALVRILLPLVLLIPTLHRIYRVREFYTLDGAPAPIWDNYGQPEFLPIPTAPVAAGMYAVLLLSLVSACVGWRTRMSLVISGVLLPYFAMVDLIGTMSKFTIVSTHVLLLMSMSSCGRTWSLDRWMARRQGFAWSEIGPAWPRRLIQFLVGVTYLGAAATKMHTPMFFSGDQLRYWMLTNVNSANPLGEYLSQFPGMILTMAYVTIVWEVLFLFIAWKGTARTVMLTMGVFFHVMTYFTLGLLVFPLVYFAIYFAWYDEQDQATWKGRWQHWFGRDFRRRLTDTDTVLPTNGGWGLPSFISWAACLVCAAALGVWIDHNSDPFGENRPEGPYTLKPITPERAAELRRNDQQIDATDKVFSLDIGSVMFNDNLVDRKHTFHHGEQANIQCSLLPPHEDLYMEAQLRNEHEQIVRRIPQIVSRENLRGHFWFEMEESLPAGSYSVVIRINGEDAGRRSLELLPDAPDAGAAPVTSTPQAPASTTNETVTSTEP